jgi:hypothetical protein
MAADDVGRRRYRRRHEYFRTTIMLCCVIPAYLYVFLYVLEGGSTEDGLSYEAIKDWERERQAEVDQAVVLVEDNNGHDGPYDYYNSSPPSSPKEETKQHLLWRILVVYTILRLWLCTMNHNGTAAPWTTGHNNGGETTPILPTTIATAPATT